MNHRNRNTPKVSSPEEMEKKLLGLFSSDFRKGILAMADALNDATEEEQRQRSEALNQLVQQIQRFCLEELSDVSASQLRNVFDLVYLKGAQLQSLPLIRPRLAYMAAKEDGFHRSRPQAKPQMYLLAYLLDELICAVNHLGDLAGLRLFLEALLAYHKVAQDPANSKRISQGKGRGSRKPSKPKSHDNRKSNRRPRR